MPKSIIRLLIIMIILLTSANANRHEDIENELINVKIELEKIKLIQQYENRDSKIKDVEKSIEDLESRLNKTAIDTKSVEQEFEKYTEIIKRQDARIGDLNASINNDITLYTSMIAILFIIISIGSYEVSSNENKKILKAWLDEKADEVFKPKVDEYLQRLEDESNSVLKEIEKEANKLNHAHKKKIIELDLMSKTISQEKKEEINSVVEELGDDEEKYSFNDWHSKFLQKYFEPDLEKALVYLEKALELATDEIDIGKLLYAKGVTLGSMGESEKEIIEYDKLIDRFSQSENENLLEQVASALVNKIETFLIKDKNIADDLELAKKLFINSKDKMVKFLMLEILDNAQRINQDEVVDNWSEEYSDITLGNFGFSELDEWNKSIEDEEIKLRVKKYIDEFKKKLP